MSNFTGEIAMYQDCQTIRDHTEKVNELFNREVALRTLAWRMKLVVVLREREMLREAIRTGDVVAARQLLEHNDSKWFPGSNPTEAKGNIQLAQRFEAACDVVYQRPPAWCKVW